MYLFIFNSTRKTDNANVIIVCNNIIDAYNLVSRQFAKYGYKGKPVLAV